MTIETTQHPFRQLAGMSFVTLGEDVQAHVEDGPWQEVLGLILVLPGGCELDVNDAELERALEAIEICDENWEDAAQRRPDLFHLDAANRLLELLVPCVVNDADLPPTRVLVPLKALRRACQAVERGAGAHTRGTAGDADRTATCRHTAAEMGRHKCRSCFRRWWAIRAKAMGVIDG